MDVGHIIEATTAPSRRDPELRDNEGEDFSQYLNDPAERREPAVTPPSRNDEPVREKVAQDQSTPANAKDPVTVTATAPEHTGAPEQTSPSTETEVATAEIPPSLETETPLTPVIDAAAIAVLPTAPIPVIAPTAATATVASTAPPKIMTPPVEAGVGQPDAGQETAAPAVPQNPVLKPAVEVAAKSTPAPETTPQMAAMIAAELAKPAKPVSPKSEAGTEKAASTPTVPVDTVIKTAVKTAPTAGTLEKIRAEATTKMTEKEILSTKIAELLQDGKGKITVTSPATKPTFQSTLASSTNIVSASLAEMSPTTTGITAQTGIPGIENPGGQLLPAAAANGLGIVDDGNGNMIPGGQAAVRGVEAAAANTASQTANAARTMGQVPVAEQISLQISNAAKEGMDRIKISLHPSELGRVDIKLELGHDGRLIAMIAVDKQETLDLLQRDARSLERALQEAGFETGSGSLNFGLNKEGGEEPSDLAQSGLPGSEEIAQLPDPDLAAIATYNSTDDTGSLDIQV